MRTQPPLAILRRSTMSTGDVGLSRQTWRHLRRAVKEFRTSGSGRWAVVLFSVLMILLLAINGLNVLNSYVGRDFMSAIEARSMHGFTRLAICYVLVYAAQTLVAVIFRFVEERLGLLWREWLTRRCVDAYLSDRLYYRLATEGGVENPDQRMTDDVRAFTTTTLSFVLMVLNGSVTALSFSGVLYSISPALFVVAVLYAGTGTALTILLGRPLVRLNYSQLDKEANFRSELIHVRQKAEALAIVGGENTILKRLTARIDDLVANYRWIIGVNRNLGFFTTGYNYFIQILPALFVAPMFISGKVEFGVIGQSAMAFATLVGAFSLIVTQFQSISSYAAVVSRLSALIGGAEKLRERVRPDLRMVAGHDRIECDGLTLRAPGGDRVLLRGLCLTINVGQSVLITGTGDEAKRALFSAMCGLNESWDGRIVLPGPDEILFLPEQPLVPHGTLREFLLGDAEKRDVDDSDTLEVLKSLGIDDAVAGVGGLDVERPWNEALSLGDQQLLAAGRVLLARPKFALLDRAGTALEGGELEKVVRLLKERSITIIAIGSAEDDVGWYYSVLELNEDASWTWNPMGQAPAEAVRAVLAQS